MLSTARLLSSRAAIPTAATAAAATRGGDLLSHWGRGMPRSSSSSSFSSSPPHQPRLLVTGALGQIGTELVPLLRERHGAGNVVASDVRKPVGVVGEGGPFAYLDILDLGGLERLVVEHRIDWLVHNASILSASGERNPELALEINVKGFTNAVEVAKRHGLRVFAPSSIAAFGPSTPRHATPDLTVMRPTTVYGVSKLYGELLGEYYHRRWDVDFRALRYPGVLSSVAPPGGGTTDYAGFYPIHPSIHPSIPEPLFEHAWFSA